MIANFFNLAQSIDDKSSELFQGLVDNLIILYNKNIGLFQYISIRDDLIDQLSKVDERIISEHSLTKSAFLAQLSNIRELVRVELSQYKDYIIEFLYYLAVQLEVDNLERMVNDYTLLYKFEYNG